MTSPAKREAAALAAGWKPHPRFSEAAREFTERQPQLTLRVWAELDGVHLLAQVHRVDPAGRLRVEEVARATWRPRAVTEISVVDWGRRALASWLERQLLEPEL